MRMGTTVVLSTGNVDIVVISRHIEPFDPGCFTSLGIDPAQAQVSDAEKPHSLSSRLSSTSRARSSNAPASASARRTIRSSASNACAGRFIRSTGSIPVKGYSPRGVFGAVSNPSNASRSTLPPREDHADRAWLRATPALRATRPAAPRRTVRRRVSSARTIAASRATIRRFARELHRHAVRRQNPEVDLSQRCRRPSAIVCGLFIGSMRPLASDRNASSAPEGSAATIFTVTPTQRAATAAPAVNPPPPTGTQICSRPGA